MHLITKWAGAAAIHLASLCLCVTCARGQDLIVTEKGDSVNCKITKIRSGNIYFTFRYENEVRSTFLPLGRVQAHQMNFYREADVPAAVVAAKQKDGGSGWLAIRPGWGYRTAPVPDGYSSDAKDYIQKLKSGFSIYADAGYSVSESLGFGVVYSGFFSKNSDPSINFNGYIANVSDRIAIHYVGPAMRSRFGNAASHYFTTNVSLGMISYRDDAILGSQSVLITGKSLGLALDFSVEFPMEKNAFILSVALFGGSLSKLDITSGNTTTTQTLNADNRENLGRINLSAGIRLSR